MKSIRLDRFQIDPLRQTSNLGIGLPGRKKPCIVLDQINAKDHSKRLAVAPKEGRSSHDGQFLDKHQVPPRRKHAAKTRSPEGDQNDSDFFSLVWLSGSSSPVMAVRLPPPRQLDL
jgi:hypothetical protein